ncbi:hypothetical protein M8C21_027104, partial [Ambrosia artemisiifolia]
THKINGPIKTLVVLVMENRSFDHMLGWLKKTRPDIDGLTGSEYNHANASDATSPIIRVSDDAVFVDSDPGHSIQAIYEQIFGSSPTQLGSPRPDPVDQAPMSGFVQEANSMGVDGLNRTVMSGFKPELLPSYTELVNEFAVFDRWFASVPASTQPNRLYVHSATSHGASSNVRKDLINGFPQKTFKYDAKRGKLPNYVVVEQRYFDVSLFPANDDHPSHDVAIGQAFVKEVYETLRASPQWDELALLITYDEHGGFYDHVATPLDHVPNPDGLIGPEPYYFGFDRLGVRVPTLLVSPWVEKGTVIHEPNGPTPYSQFEHSSIAATVKKLFNLDSDFLTKRDEWAGTFESYFNIRTTPRDDCPEKLPEITVSLRPRGPNEDMKLTEFQVELIQLASQLNGDHILNSYPNIGKNMTVGEAHHYANDAVTRFLEAGRAALLAGANESTIVTMRPALSSRSSQR